jgi:hypothetical protein
MAISKPLFIEYFYNDQGSYNFELMRDEDNFKFIFSSALASMTVGITPNLNPAQTSNLQATIMSLFTGIGEIEMVNGFTTFGLWIAASITSVGTFVATPPPTPISFLDLTTKGYNGLFVDSIDGLKEFCNLIDEWLKNGTAIPTVGGPMIFWS